MQDLLRRCYADIQEIVTSFCSDPETVEKTEQVARMLADIFQSGGKGVICGNGGSTSDSTHFAEEFTGRFRKNRRPLPVMAISEASHLTCVANDFGYDQVFVRSVEAFGKPNDVLFALSTSGNSENVILAVEKAKEIGMKTVGLLGKDGGKLKGVCDVEWIVPAQGADRIQEVHMMVLHIIIEGVEALLFPENS